MGSVPPGEIAKWGAFPEPVAGIFGGYGSRRSVIVCSRHVFLHPRHGRPPRPSCPCPWALCFVLALGALLDLSKPPLSEEANRFFQLGRAALSVDSILESQSVPAIQALVRISRPPFYICAPRADQPHNGRPPGRCRAFAPMSTDRCSSHVNRSSCANTCSFPSSTALAGSSWASRSNWHRV